MITLNPQPALNQQLRSVDRTAATPVEAQPETSAVDLLDPAFDHFDSLLEDLPEDFNGILVY